MIWPRPAHAPAQLVELRKPKALGILNHHDRGFRNIDANFNHRRRNQNIESPGFEIRHDGILGRPLEPPMDEANPPRKLLLKMLEAVFRRRQIDKLAFLHQRANPIGPLPAFDAAAQPRHNLIHAVQRQHARIDRKPPGGFLGELGDIHIAIDRQRQRARNGRCRHDQKVRGASRLRLQGKPLMHAEAMLLVDHHKAKVLELNAFLKQRMGADQNINPARRKALQNILPLLALFAARENRNGNPRRRAKRREGREDAAAPEFRLAP